MEQPPRVPNPSAEFHSSYRVNVYHMPALAQVCNPYLDNVKALLSYLSVAVPPTYVTHTQITTAILDIG